MHDPRDTSNGETGMTAESGGRAAAGRLRDVWSGRAVLVSMAALLAEAMCATVGVVGGGEG
ncbi:hypothetical protein JCM4914_43130 [Streptomyces platensis subsp. malvinus]